MSSAVLITGATGGLGRRTTLRLAGAGRDVIVGGRRADAVDAVCEEARALGVQARPFVADLSSLAQVDAALAALGDVSLHGIVANAGITTEEDETSADGVEITFAVNVLAHELVFRRLMPRLEPGGRVVVVSSGVHLPDNRLARNAGVPVPRWVGAEVLAHQAQAAPEHVLPGRQRYSTSKLANVLQARTLQTRLRAAGQAVDVFAIDPGLMVDTDLARELPKPLQLVFRGVGRLLTPCIDNMRLSTVSAGHILSLVEDPDWHGQGFSYLDGDRARPPSDDAQRDDLRLDLESTSSRLLAPFLGIERPILAGQPAR